jgi:LysM repeat protein
MVAYSTSRKSLKRANKGFNKRQVKNQASKFTVFGGKSNLPKRRSTKSNPVNIETEKMLRFLSFCVVVCLGVVLAQTFLNTQENVSAAAQEPKEVKIYTLFSDTANNPQSQDQAVLVPVDIAATTDNQSNTSQEAEQTVQESLPPAPSQPVTYVVQPGDNLSVISAKFETTTTNLADLNNLSDPRSLSVGQELLIRVQ